MASEVLAVGCGAGFSADRLDPACALAASGRVRFLALECVGERTLAHGHRDRMVDPLAGFNSLLTRRMEKLLPVCRQSGTRIVTNMGAANPKGAAEATLRVARELGLDGLTVAYVSGDDVSGMVTPDWTLHETGDTVAALGLPVVGANAYLGIEHLLPAVQSGADVIITGRFADPALFMAPIADHFGWRLDDWDRLAAGTVMGHLLECGMQITGGYFADPPHKIVPDLVRCGYPYAETQEDGACIVTKLEDAGGCVTLQTVKEQLFYEIHDPTAYLTPDVTADFSGVVLEEVGQDRIRVSGAKGRPRPETLKVTIGFDGGYQGEGGISYAGPGAQDRARLAREIIMARVREQHRLSGRLRVDLIGMNSLHASATDRPTDTQDVRLHATYVDADRAAVETAMWEVESLLCCGPAGGGGFRGQISPKVVTQSSFMPRDRIVAETHMMEA